MFSHRKKGGKEYAWPSAKEKKKRDIPRKSSGKWTTVPKKKVCSFNYRKEEGTSGKKQTNSLKKVLE